MGGSSEPQERRIRDRPLQHLVGLEGTSSLGLKGPLPGNELVRRKDSEPRDLSLFAERVFVLDWLIMGQLKLIRALHPTF